MSLKYIHEIDELPLMTLIVGAGAVENAWTPIINVVKECNLGDIDVTADMANSFFSRLIYIMRFNATLDAKENNKEYYTEIINHYNQIKTEISSALKIAQKENVIRARDQLKVILSRFTRGRVAVINTNWDTVIDNAINEMYMTDDGMDIL